MKFSAVVHGKATPIKRGDVHAVVAAASRFLDWNPSDTVAIRRTDETRSHAHDLHRHRGDRWTLTTTYSAVFPANEPAAEDERTVIIQALRSLGIRTSEQSDT